MNLSIKLTQDQSAKMLRLKDGAAQVLRPLAVAWGRASQEVIGAAVKYRFTGKGPFPHAQNRLGVVTNRLRKSMRATGGQVDTATGGISSSMGSNVRYFAGHEFGFKGQVQVRGHARKAIADKRRTPRGKLTKATIAARKDNAGRANFSYVRPHSRRVNLRARRPLGTQLDSIQTRLTFRKAISGVLNRFLRS